MNKNLLEPLIFASGISLFLFGHNSDLSLGAYLAPFPFWVVVGRPLGLLWNRNVLKELNKDIFPAEMRNYRELYLVSKRALAYDVLFNHSVYNPLLATIIIGYTYSARRIEQRLRGEPDTIQPLSEIVKKIGLSLVKVRALVSLTSIISEYWISYLSIQKSKEGVMSISTGNKRLLLLKEMILNFGWNAYLLKKVNENCL
jgi:hypothetical protein